MGKDLKGKELGEGLSQRKDGVYLARFTDRFSKRQYLYDTNLSLLKTAFNKAKYEDSEKLNVIDNKMTLNEWYFKWLNVHKYKVICANTKRLYEQVFSQHISPVLGKFKLQDFTLVQVKEFIIGLEKKGLGYESQSRAKIMLSDMFDKAMIDDLIRKNPARGIKLERNEDRDIRVLTVEEQAEFFECCRGTFYDNLFTVAVCTGLRMGELCALTWNDIDFEKMEININKTLLYQKLEGDNQKEFHITPPKTKSSIRKVPINRQCELALKKQRMQKNVIENKSPKKVSDEFKNLLFTTKFNTPINDQVFNDAIKTIVNEINLCKDALEEMELLSSHCFRHTFATRCFEAGIQPKTVQCYLGHATLQMTMDLYVKVLKIQKDKEMQLLENALITALNVSDGTIETRYQNSINGEKSNIIEFNGVRMG